MDPPLEQRARDGESGSGSAGSPPLPAGRGDHRHHPHHQPHHHQAHYHHHPSPLHPRDYDHRGHHHQPYRGGGGGGRYVAAPPRHAAATPAASSAADEGDDEDFPPAYAALRLAGVAEDLDELLGDGSSTTTTTTTTTDPSSSPKAAAAAAREQVGAALLRLAARLRPPLEAHRARRDLAARVRAALARLPELEAAPVPACGLRVVVPPPALAHYPGGGGYNARGGGPRPHTPPRPPPPPRGGPGGPLIVPLRLSTFGSSRTGLFFEDSDVDLCLSGFLWRRPPCGSWRRLRPRRQQSGEGGEGDENNNASDLLIPLHEPDADPYYDPDVDDVDEDEEREDELRAGALAPVASLTPLQSNALLTRALAALRAEGVVASGHETEVVSRARVPVVKWTDRRTGLPCDLCLGNHQAVFKSLLLRALLDGLSWAAGAGAGAGAATAACAAAAAAAAADGGGGKNDDARPTALPLGPADRCARLAKLSRELDAAEALLRRAARARAEAESGGGGAEDDAQAAAARCLEARRAEAFADKRAAELAKLRVPPPAERLSEEDEEEDGATAADDKEGDDSHLLPPFLRSPPTLLEALYRLVKLWARQKGANDPSQNTLNSWALLQMVLLHLQRRRVASGGGAGVAASSSARPLLPPLELLFPGSVGGAAPPPPEDEAEDEYEEVKGATAAGRPQNHSHAHHHHSRPHAARRPLSGVRLQDHGAPYHLLVGLSRRCADLARRGHFVSPSVTGGGGGGGSSEGGSSVFRGGGKGDEKEDDEDDDHDNCSSWHPSPRASRLACSELALFFARWSRALHLQLSRAAAHQADAAATAPRGPACFRCGLTGHIARNCPSGLPFRASPAPQAYSPAPSRQQQGPRASTWRGAWLRGRPFRVGYVLLLEDPFDEDDCPARTVGAWGVPGIHACVSHLAGLFRHGEWAMRDGVAAARRARTTTGEQEQAGAASSSAAAIAASEAVFSGARALFAELPEHDRAPQLQNGRQFRREGPGPLPEGAVAAVARAAAELSQALTLLPADLGALRVSAAPSSLSAPPGMQRPPQQQEQQPVAEAASACVLG
jgi:hypothetical protein